MTARGTRIAACAALGLALLGAGWGWRALRHRPGFAGLPEVDAKRGFVRGVLAVFDSHRTFVKVAIENEHLKLPASTIPQDLLDGAIRIVAAGVAEGALSEDKAALLPILITSAIKAVCVHRVRTGGEFAADAEPLVELLLDGARRARPAGAPP